MDDDQMSPSLNIQYGSMGITCVIPHLLVHGLSDI